MTAKEYLSQYKKIDAEIKCKNTLIEKLESKAEYSSPAFNSTGMGNGASDKVGNIVTKIADLKRELDIKKLLLVEKQEEILSVIEKLDDSTERTILEEHYINGFVLDDIPSIIHYSRRQMYNFYKSAIYKVQMIIDKELH